MFGSEQEMDPFGNIIHTGQSSTILNDKMPRDIHGDILPSISQSIFDDKFNESLKKNDDYGLPGPTIAELFPTPVGDTPEGAEMIFENQMPSHPIEWIPRLREDGKWVIRIEGKDIVIKWDIDKQSNSSAESGWALGSDQTFAEKLKEAYEQLRQSITKATQLVFEVDNLMAHFSPTNNPQEMTPSEEKLKTLIEQGFEKIEQSLTTIREANQKTSPCVCSKVNLKPVKPTENEATQ